MEEGMIKEHIGHDCHCQPKCDPSDTPSPEAVAKAKAVVEKWIQVLDAPRESLEQFIALLVDATARETREACAKLGEDMLGTFGTPNEVPLDDYGREVIKEYIAAIRASGTGS